jgi:predicted CopG family antitoxin
MRYSTISVPEDVKRQLEKAKGKRQWGEFLLALYEEAQRLRSERTFRKLSEILTEDDLRDICNSSREFRESFKLR